MSDYKKEREKAFKIIEKAEKGEPIVSPFIESIDDDAEQTEPVKPAETEDEREARLEREAIQDDGRTYDDWKAEAEAPSEPTKPKLPKPSITIDDADDADDADDERDAYKQAEPAPLLPIFPSSVLEIPIFQNYIEAHAGATEAPMEYHFGVLKCAIGASLGRRIYLDDNLPIYANSYVALIGQSGRARKSHAMSLGFKVLKESDRCVKTLRKINSSEGLYNYFGVPRGCKLGEGLPNFDPEIDEQDEQDDEFQMPQDGMGKFVNDPYELDEMLCETHYNEGFRVIARIGELSALLLKAKNQTVASLIPDLQEMYDMEDEIERNTKSDPLRAPFPCFSLIGASTTEQFHKALNASDIHGGLANRFEYYIASPREKHMWGKPSDHALLGKVKGELNRLRGSFPHQTKFKVTKEVLNLGEQVYAGQVDVHDKESNAFVRDALSRWELQLKKNALIFAALRLADAGTGECHIVKEDFDYAYDLQRYLIGCAKCLYEQFTETILGSVEKKILNAIDRGLHTAGRIKSAARIDNAKVLMEALDSMLRAGVLTIDNNNKYYRA